MRQGQRLHVGSWDELGELGCELRVAGAQHRFWAHRVCARCCVGMVIGHQGAVWESRRDCEQRQNDHSRFRYLFLGLSTSQDPLSL